MQLPQVPASSLLKLLCARLRMRTPLQVLNMLCVSRSASLCTNFRTFAMRSARSLFSAICFCIRIRFSARSALRFALHWLSLSARKRALNAFSLSALRASLCSMRATTHSNAVGTLVHSNSFILICPYDWLILCPTYDANIVHCYTCGAVIVCY